MKTIEKQWDKEIEAEQETRRESVFIHLTT